MIACCYDWGYKRKIETETVEDTKKHFWSVSRIGKNAGISVLYLNLKILKKTVIFLITPRIFKNIVGKTNIQVNIQKLVESMTLKCETVNINEGFIARY